ncbi:hypothetical protein OAU50_02795 [Planctomycetota bacterium]|nr:hypothetical protein [Planctomycetota bacterium]
MRSAWVKVDGAETNFSALESCVLLARHFHGIGNTDHAQETFRRLCAANMSTEDFKRYAWRRDVAKRHFVTVKKKLMQAGLVDKQYHMTECGLIFAKRLKDIWHERMPFGDFKAVTRNIYTQKTKRLGA